MNPAAGVNSVQWWDEYFRSDWERHGGPDQTRHFMQRLLGALPEVDRAVLAEQALSVVDWGCALGDGCEELARTFPLARVTGLDVSAEAVRAAQRRYPEICFEVTSPADAGALPSDFDLVINSNCLEHFDAPLEILAANLRRTRLLHLSLVPYREQPLSVHHKVCLDEHSFPPVLAGFTRLFAAEVAVDPDYWPSGRQLLVAYASPAYLELRKERGRSLAERGKWDAYYADLPFAEVDPLTKSFNEELAVAVRELLPAGGRLLEAGCGGGSQSLALAAAGFDVSLLDFSKAALGYARRTFESHGLAARLIEDDAFALRQPEYDLVFNAGVLEHYSLTEQARFLRGMASRSRRYVLVLIPNRACYWYWIWRARKTAAFDWPFGKEVPQTSLADAFGAAGIDYLGENFLGAAWTESFIENLDGLDAHTRQLLIELHRSPVVPAMNKGYLLAALGRVDQREARLPVRWRTASAAASAVRREEEWTALLADALAGRIGAEQTAARERSELSAQIEAMRRATEDALQAARQDAQRMLEQARADADREREALSTQLAASEAERLGIQQQLSAQLAASEVERSRMQQQLSAQLNELNLANGKLIELNRQLHEVSEWGRQSAERAGALQERIRVLEDDARRRTGARMRRAWQALRTEPPVEWARRIYRRLPLTPAQRHRIGVAVNRWRRRGAAAVPVPPVAPEPAALRAGHGADVFVFAIIDWHFRIQRPQQLARALAQRGHRVFYVSNHFADALEPGFRLEPLDAQLPLYQVRLNARGAPAIYFSAPDADALSQLQAGLAQLLLQVRPARALAIVEHAWWWPLAGALPNATSMFDCMDHHEGFGNVPEVLLEMERRVVREADLVITTSDWLAQRLAADRPDVVLIRNGCDPQHFGQAPAATHRDRLGRRTIGYFGAIAEWFDLDLVRAVAQAHPDTRVLLIGDDTAGARDRLADCGNVEFTGELPYDALPAYLHAFDVCLLPFKVVPLTLATNPVKVYEYLAAGKPVVAVDLPEIAQFGELVRVARDTAGFVAAVGAALREVQDEPRIEARRAFAARQSWSARAQAIDQALLALAEPRVSVVVLTYNNLALTQRCLQSLLESSDYPNLDLIIVDNASTDGSREWLREFAERHPGTRLILNDRNLGFAAGNNLGLRQASGEFLVVLNNDTQVTHGWVRTMLKHFRRNPRLGMLGPVTNNIGNEAKIDLEYSTPQQMTERAADFTLRHGGRTHPLRTAAFFCVMLRADVYRQVGGLCEDFGIGFFEDDDYCRRVEAAGWQIACADDVFVHHELSASFGKLPGEERQRLFEQNLRLYESKWGKWQPHRYRADRGAGNGQR
jgi:GT2 family glycosyltransferase/2-polyprenyl-3-methyl-5-hydroxy-6-metoxy-1,4-benzoquinol methylase/glycosyltransferase involved in cell wall biosynthesis